MTARAQKVERTNRPPMRDVATAARELASIADRLGLRGAANALRGIGQEVDRGADTGERVAGAIVEAKEAYDQSATKRIAGMLVDLGRTLNARKTALGRVRKPPTGTRSGTAGQAPPKDVGSTSQAESQARGRPEEKRP